MGTLGLDIGGTKILGILYDENGMEIARQKRKTKAAEGLDVVMNQVYKVIDAMTESSGDRLDGIGVGVPGLVNVEGTVLFSPNIPFKDFELSKLLKKRYNVPVYVGNDVNVAMYGEWKHIGNDATHDVLGMFIGTGVGGAIIINGELYLGQGSAGEFGHMVVSADGAYCGCGAQGCLEAYASKTAIQKYIEKQIGKGRTSLLSDLLKEDGPVLKSSSLIKAYDKNDPLAIEVIDRTARYLGIAVGSLVNLFHPDQFILGGGVMEALGEILLDKTLNEAQQHAMPGLLKSVDFSLSVMGDEAGVYGAYQLIKSKL